MGGDTGAGAGAGAAGGVGATDAGASAGGDTGADAGGAVDGGASPTDVGASAGGDTGADAGGIGGTIETGGGTAGGTSSGVGGGAAGNAGAVGIACPGPCQPRDDCDLSAHCEPSTGRCAYVSLQSAFCAPLPALQPSSIDQTVPPNLRTQTQFLYAGTDPIQKELDPAILEDQRIAVVNGRIGQRPSGALSRVKVSIKGHPEFGYTLSRYDGEFDLVVNGGASLTVEFERPGYLPAQRQVDVPWRDYARVSDVVLIQIDDAPTQISSSSTSVTVHQTKVETDASGSRHMSLFFMPGTTASYTLPAPSCAEQVLANFHVQGAEYTVGDLGPSSMPAPLPPTSAYTYAIELQVVEAVAAGASTVHFSQPVIAYLDNFLGIPVGANVPVGFLDRDAAQWFPEKTGRVVRVGPITNGLAALFVDASGSPATPEALAALGITEAELRQVASLYPEDTQLWRTEFDHFSDPDCNYSSRPPPNRQIVISGGSPAPSGSTLGGNGGRDDSARKCGSIIECHNQVLGETIPIVGSPLTLNYRSNLVPDWNRSVQVKLTAEAESASYRNRKLNLSVAGREYAVDIPARAVNGEPFTIDAWDGTDRFGRKLQGPVTATVAASAETDFVYCNAPSFGQFPSDCFDTATRYPIAARRELGTVELSQWDARGFGIGGWTLGIHHVFDRNQNVLIQGNGERRTPESLPRVMTSVAGGGLGDLGDGGLASQATLSLTRSFGDVVVAADGSILFSDGCRVRKVEHGTGTISTIAGTGTCPQVGWVPPEPRPGVCGAPSSDPLATEVDLYPRGIDIGPDGAVYIASSPSTGNGPGSGYGRDIDIGLGFIFRLDVTSGTLRHIAGSAAPTSLGDAGPALQAGIGPADVAVGRDGAIYIADLSNARVRRIGTDGIIETVAGAGQAAHCARGTSAKTSLGQPTSLAVDKNGFVYATDSECGDVLVITPDGQVSVVTDKRALGPPPGAVPIDVALAGDGALLVSATQSFAPALNSPKVVVLVRPDGSVTPLAGGGSARFSSAVPATAIGFDGYGDLSLAHSPSGAVLVRDPGSNRILQVFPEPAGVEASHFLVSNETGDQLFEFDADGRHLRTLDALTRAAIYTFVYDSAKRLIGVRDVDQNLTSFTLDAAGNPTEIVSPYGQRTTLAYDSNGFLASVVNPAGNSTAMTYTPGGLLTSLTDGRGAAHHFGYDPSGRLVSDSDRKNATQTLQREELASGYRVSVSSPLERKTDYEIALSGVPGGSRTLTTTAPDLTSSIVHRDADGSTQNTSPDGSLRQTVNRPDPRFGMRAPMVASDTITTPNGIVSSTTSARTVVLSVPDDPLSPVTSVTEQVKVNGRLFTSLFESASKRYTRTSPMLRKSYETIDDAGRVVLREVPGLAATSFAYDARGRLLTIQQGSAGSARTTSFEYDATDGWLTKITDPFNRTTEFKLRDKSGRVQTEVLPGARSVLFSYDANSNLSSVTPPEKPSHAFEYDANDLMSAYTPPPSAPAASGPWATGYSYDPDRALDTVTRPDGLSLKYGYEANGRLKSVLYPAPNNVSSKESISLGYDDAGRPHTLSSGSGVTLTYEYDGPLPIQETWSGTVAGVLLRHYDENFRVDSETVEGTVPIAFSYDDDGLLIQAGALTLGRNPDNGLLGSTTLDQLSEIVGHNEFGELANFSAFGPAGASLLSVSYQRDQLARIVEKSETIGGVTSVFGYEYDAAGRLHIVSKDAVQTASYAYDANGNRTLVQVPGKTDLTPSYDDQDRLTSYGDASYAYTQNGELSSKTTAAGTTAFTYDVLGNLRRVALPSGDTIDYLVDAKNRRVGKRVNGNLTQAFLYENALSPVAELDGSGNIVSRFVFGTRVNVPEYLIRDGKTYRLITDHLGSVRLVVDAATGAIAQRIDYDEWGVVLSDTAPGFQPFGFAGGIYDGETGLVRFGARDYDARIGRWTSKDPMRFEGGDDNLFEYVAGAPTVAADPLGLYQCVYSIGSHTMACFASDPRDSDFVSNDAVSGRNNSQCSDCQDNPTQTGVRYNGPLPMGDYIIGPQIPGTNRRSLAPQFDMTATNRSGGFQTHGCANRATCSEGCVAFTTNSLRDQFNNLMNREGSEGLTNRLYVQP
jgi:RHS repeat-associated protein